MGTMLGSCSSRKGLRTNVPGFYVAEDAIGWARGIIQAATTGIVIARDILNDKNLAIRS